MKFASTIIALAALFSVAVASPTSRASPTTVEPVRPNNFYDNKYQSLSNVACSDGVNGLVTRGFTTFDSLPTFPNIGGVFAVERWNSTECGSCWALTWEGTGVTIHVTAIDTVYSGFDISDAAVNTLTGGNAGPSFSEVDVDATQVDPSYCGLPWYVAITPSVGPHLIFLLKIRVFVFVRDFEPGTFFGLCS